MLIQIYKNIKKFARNHWLTTAFLLGFFVDLITLNKVDSVFDNAVLFFYVVLALTSTLLLYAGVAERFSEKTSKFLRRRAPLAMQYSFGGLLSGMLIFYGRSSSIEDSWFFLLIFIGVIYGNETIKDRSGRLLYNLLMLFVGLFAYTTLVIPVWTGKMGPWVFVGSGMVAVFVMYLFFRALIKIVPNFMKLQMRNAVFIVGLLYISMNVLYFTNIIPPIPLSLKHVGVYHNVIRYDDRDVYELTYEEPAWWEIFRKSDRNFRYESGDEVYCFAAVFAPARLATEVWHRWEYENPETGEWELHGRYTYPIRGGRSDGYRGYTLIGGYHEGKWRCTVETKRGQVIGKEVFQIQSGEKKGLVTRIE